jgi:hypothetical protein
MDQAVVESLLQEEVLMVAAHLVLSLVEEMDLVEVELLSPAVEQTTYPSLAVDLVIMEMAVGLFLPIL